MGKRAGSGARGGRSGHSMGAERSGQAGRSGHSGGSNESRGGRGRNGYGAGNRTKQQAKDLADRQNANAEGKSDRAKVNVGLGLLGLINPLAPALGWVAVELVAAVKDFTAKTPEEKGYASGLDDGPEKSRAESVAGLGLKAASLLGVPSGFTKVGGIGLDMHTAARLDPDKSVSRGPGVNRELTGADRPLGSFTSDQAVRRALNSIKVSATDDQVKTLAKDYNARNDVHVRKSKALNTPPDRYNYLRSGWKV